MASPEFIALEDVTRGEGLEASRPQSIADRFLGMLSKQGETPSWDDEDFSDRRSCASVNPYGTPVRRSARLSWASDATSHEGDQRARSPAANSPRKKGSRRAGILAQVSARFSAGRRSSRSSNASAASSDVDEPHTKSKGGVWARLEARRAASSPLGRSSWRNSRASGATAYDAGKPPFKSPLVTSDRTTSAREELEALGKGRLSVGTTLEEIEGFGKTALPPSPRLYPLPMSDADAAVKRQVDSVIARKAAQTPTPTPTPPASGRGATSPVTLRRSARRIGVSSPYSSPTGRRSRGPWPRRTTSPSVLPGASSAPGAVGGGGSSTPTGQPRHEARGQSDQGRYISYWRRLAPPPKAEMQLGLHAARAAGLLRRGEEEGDLLAQLGLRLQAAADAKALLDFEFSHIEPKLDLGRLLTSSDTGQRSDLTATVGVLRRHFGALKRVHEAFAARNKSWQMAGGPKSTRCGLPHVLATHVISKNELHLLIDETGMLGGRLDRTMADVIFVRCSLRTLQQVATAPMRLHYDYTMTPSPGVGRRPLSSRRASRHRLLLTHSRTHARTLARSLARTHVVTEALTHLGNWEIDVATGLASPDDNNPDNELMLHEMLAAFVRLAAARYNDKARAVTKASAPKPLPSQRSAPFPRLADKTEELLRAFVLPLEK